MIYLSDQSTRISYPLFCGDDLLYKQVITEFMYNRILFFIQNISQFLIGLKLPVNF